MARDGWPLAPTPGKEIPMVTGPSMVAALARAARKFPDRSPGAGSDSGPRRGPELSADTDRPVAIRRRRARLIPLLLSLVVPAVLMVGLPGQTLAASPGNDFFANATRVSGSFFEELSTSESTRQSGEPWPDCVGDTGHSVWYRYYAPGPRSLYVDTSGSDFDTVLALYEGSSLANLNQVDCDDDSWSGHASVLTTSVRGDRTYYIQVSGYGDDAGNLAFYFDASDASDYTPPSVEGPVPVAHVPSTLAVGSTEMVWDGHDDESGISYFQLQQSKNWGAWRNVPLSSDRARRARIWEGVDTGVPVQFRVRAADNAGNISGWAVGPRFTPLKTQDAAAAVTYSGKWKKVRDTHASGNTTTYSTRDGSRASLTFKGRAVGFVTSKGPNRGVAHIIVDGVRRATVSLYAPRVRQTQLVFGWSWARSTVHTIAIVVRGSGARVDIDAFTFYR
jgi:hypothetical protein